MKILNLFAGIGGNRTLWGDQYNIVAIENNKQIAYIYEKRFPDDIMVVGDAYEYFLENFQDYDIVWASPPCTSHTKLTHTIVGNRYKGNNYKCRLPDLRLYSLILFLQTHFRGDWIVENVKGYYKPLIKPNVEVGRHWIWTNKVIHPKKKEKSMGFLSREEYNLNIDHALEVKMINKELYDILLKFDIMTRKQIINNTMLPKEGKYILDSITNKKQLSIEVFK